MKIEIMQKFKIPSSTPQQRKLGGKATYPTQGLRLARASWQALLETKKPDRPMDRPIRLHVSLCYHSAKGKLRPKTTRPDGDNLLKIIKDAATKAGWWLDDNLVFDERICRYYVNTEDRVIIIAAEEDEPWTI